MLTMPDSVLAAIIAGTATLSASLLQLRSALLREAARGQSEEASFTRRKQRHGPQDPAWAKSGLFRPGFNIGPLLRGAKLFTKGKAKE